MKKKQIWRNIVFGLAILFTSFSIFELVMHKQVLQAGLYNEAFEQAGIYPVVAGIMEAKVSGALISLGEESENGKLLNFATTFILGEVIERQIPMFVESIFEEIQLEQILQGVTEETIKRDIAWLEEGDEATSHTSTTEELDKLQERINDAIPTELLERAGIEVSGSIEGIIANVQEVNYELVELRQTVLSFREKFWKIQNAALVVLLLSVVCTILAVYLSKDEKRLKVLTVIYFYSGLTIIFLSVVYWLVVSSIITKKIPDSISFGAEALTQNEEVLLTTSIQSAITFIAKGLVRQDLIVGIWMVGLSALVYGIIKLVENWSMIAKKISEVLSPKGK